MNSIALTSIKKFLADLASGRIFPAGGSAAAVTASLGAALIGMTAQTTLGRSRYKDYFSLMEKTAKQAEALQNALIDLAQKELIVLRNIENALHLPQNNMKNKAFRKQSLEDAWFKAAKSSFNILNYSKKTFELASDIFAKFNKNATGDFIAAIYHLHASANISCLNLSLNLEKKDSEESKILYKEAQKTHKECEVYFQKLKQID